MYVCLCKGLTETDVRRAGQACPMNADALAQTLGLDDRDCCGRCARNIDRFVALAASPLSCRTAEQPHTV